VSAIEELVSQSGSGQPSQIVVAAFEETVFAGLEEVEMRPFEERSLRFSTEVQLVEAHGCG